VLALAQGERLGTSLSVAVTPSLPPEPVVEQLADAADDRGQQQGTVGILVAVEAHGFVP
jgi:hypothetical protein